MIADEEMSKGGLLVSKAFIIFAIDGAEVRRSAL